MSQMRQLENKSKLFSTISISELDSMYYKEDIQLIKKL